MSCKKSERIEALVKEGLSEEAAKEAVEAVNKMSMGEKVDYIGHPHTRLVKLANTAGATYLGSPVELTRLKKTEKGYSFEGKDLETKRDISIAVEGVLTLSLDNGMELTKEQLDGLVADLKHIHNMNGYEELVTDLLNDPKKIVGLAKDIADDTDSALYKEELFNNLRNIVPSLTKLKEQINVQLSKLENDTDGFIELSENNIDIYLADNPENRRKSNLEVYVHELFHAVTTYTLRSKDPGVEGIKRDIRNIRSDFIENVKAKDLVRWSAKDASEKPMTLEEAENLIDYISNEETGLEEFVAHAMSNRAVMRSLYTYKNNIPLEEYPNLVAKIVGIVRKLVEKASNKIRKVPSKNDYEKMVWLVNRLATSHEKQAVNKRFRIIDNVLNVFEETEEKIKKRIEQYSDKRKSIQIPYPKKPTAFSNAVYASRLAYNSFFDETAKRRLEWVLSSFGSSFKPESSLMTGIRDMSQSDSTQDMAENMGLVSQQIDQGREFRFGQVRLNVEKGFKERPTDEQFELMTDVLLDTDISALSDVYNIDTLMSQNNLNNAIKSLEDTLNSNTDNASYNYYIAQAKGLANFMVTGAGNMAQLLNARNIAMKLNTDDRKLGVSEDIVKNIDMLTSLYALKNVNQDKRSQMKELIAKEPEGVANLIAYQRGIRDKSEKELFSSTSDKFLMTKGHHSEIFGDDREVIVRPVSAEKELKRQGYKLVKKLKKHELDSNKVEMAQYESNMQITQPFHRVGMRMTDKHRIGTTITESYYIAENLNGSALAKKDIDKMKELQRDIISEMEAGTYDVNQQTENNLIPLLSSTGRVKDFRYVMLKKDKKEILDMDRRADHILGRTYATMFDKTMSAQFNDELMELIKEDAVENYQEGRTLGRNMKEYIKIEKNSSNEEIRDFWQILPNDIKRKYSNGFMVRRDLMYSYLGFRELKVTDLPVIKDMSPIIKYSLRVAEVIWKEIIRISKADVIIRTPGVLLGNIMSNFFIPIMMGYSPKEVIQLKLQGVRELTEYVKATKDLISIQAKIDAGIATKTDKRKARMLKENIDKSAIKDLVDAGFYTSIIEEMEYGEESAKGPIQKAISNRLNNVPKIVKDGANLLYITENTKLYKLVSTATQYSDFVARYAQYHLMRKKGIDDGTAIKTVRDYYINYNKPNGKFVEWLNQMGFVMFTKYFTRIQKAVRDYGTNHPLKALLFVTGQYALIGDVDDITDQSVLVKDLGVIFYNPVDNFFRAVTPSSLEAVDYIINK